MVHNSCTDRLKTLQFENNKLIGNKQMNDMKVSALRTENKRLKTEYEKLEEKYDNLELENNYCKDKLNDIESENDQFKANGQKNDVKIEPGEILATTTNLNEEI